MSLLYKEQSDIIYEAEIATRESTEEIKIVFSSDCGKFGTDEILDGYKLTPKRLLQILQDRDDYTEEELNI